MTHPTENQLNPGPRDQPRDDAHDARIISLIASATEIVCSLGLEHRLVGRSHECDFPPPVLSLPVCTRPRFDIAGSSSEIDRRVKALAWESAAQAAVSVYEVFPAQLQALRPTHIVTQTQCEVCAVSLKDVERAVQQLTGCDATIVSLQPNALADVWEDICRLASSLGVTEAGVRLVADLQKRMEDIEARTRPIQNQPTVAGIEWVDPPMAIGNWMPELVRMAGGKNLFGEPGDHSPWIEWKDVFAADPEVIFVAPCGFDIPRARQDLPILTSLPGWSNLKAVRRGRVYVGDGNQYFNRPGPRLAESLEILAEVLHPEIFHFGHEGRGWERVVGASR